VHHPLVLHHEGDLDNEVEVDREAEKTGEGGIIEGVAVVVGMEANAETAPGAGGPVEVVFPVGEHGVDRRERTEADTAGPSAGLDQARVGGAKVLVEEAVESARPSRMDAAGAEPGGEAFGGVIGQPAQGPLAEADVDIDTGSWQ
jgi:hypothetical protein